MPIRATERHRYPPNWPEISRAATRRARKAARDLFEGEGTR